MALLKSTELSSGISGNYWKIGSVVVACTSDPVVTIYMELYLNRSSKYSGKTALQTIPVNMSLSQIDPTFDYDFRACVYNAMLNLDGWNSARFLYEFDETYETRPIVNYLEIESNYNGSVNLPAFEGSDLNNLPLTYDISTQPSNGTITESNGVFTYTPNADWSGSDVALYRAFNGTEYSKPATIFLTVVSDVPTANNVSLEANYNGSAVVNLSGTDPNNLNLTYSIVNQPSNGTITENNGVFTYTPNQDWSGSDSATYKANNGTYDSNTASISLVVYSDVPTANDISASCEQNGSVDLGFNGNDPSNLPLTFSIVAQPTHGNIIETNGVFTYYPETDFIGSDTATYLANNGTYDSNIANITIDVTAV